MRIKRYILQFKLLIILALIHCCSANLLAGENLIGKDTMVYKPYKDTVRLVKAQVYDLNSSESVLFYKPRPFDFIKNVPSDLAQFGKTVVAKENIPTVCLLVGTTAVLMALDQPLLDAAQRFGRYIHLDASHKFNRVSINIGSLKAPIVDVPQNLNSSLYFIGEGWPSILVAGGFWGYGIIKDDYRARQTSSELTEMFFTLAITCQTLKRVAGRQSPMNSSTPGGEWHPLTKPATYASNVSNFDAFPSGHLATVMATITILSGNYPDNKYIKPVGYSVMGLVGFAMMNNGVHWAGDYPIAIAIGYTCGKIALSRGKKNIHKKSTVTDYNPKVTGCTSSLMPTFFGQSGYGLSYRLTF